LRIGTKVLASVLALLVQKYLLYSISAQREAQHRQTLQTIMVQHGLLGKKVLAFPVQKYKY
jgi:hypothetical protein